jgi:hypothetical protein
MMSDYSACILSNTLRMALVWLFWATGVKLHWWFPGGLNWTIPVVLMFLVRTDCLAGNKYCACGDDGED